MKYELVKSTNFIRSAVKLAKKNPNFLIELNEALTLLTENPFDIKLKTHKLKGELNKFWACSINYNIRIIFQFTRAINKDSKELTESILLSTIGSHDEVY